MKNISLKASSLVVAVLATVLLIYSVPGTYEHPLATIVNKVNLIKSTSSPRIIFVGGSEVLVGVNSEMVYRRFGRTVVNMAVYGGFGISDMLHLVEPHVGKGDIVVIIPEYGVLNGDFNSDDVSNKWIFLLSPRYAFEKIYCSNGKLAFLAGDISDLLQCKIEGMWGELWMGKNPFIDGAAAYARRSNRFGDLMKNWEYVPAEKLAGRGYLLQPDPIKPVIIRTLNDFYSAAAKGNAAVYLSFSGFPAGEYERNRAVIESMADQLRKSLGFPVLGSPADTIFPYEYFSNTIYHLRFEGRDKRTAILIGAMEKAKIQPAGTKGVR